MDIVDLLLRVALLGSTWVLWLLIALSIASIGAMIERWVFFLRNRAGGAELQTSLTRALHNGDEGQVERILNVNRSVEAAVLREAFRWRHGGPEAVDDVVEAELVQSRQRLERSMTLLGTLGNNAPFIGLFGTVLGVIEAFQHLSHGNQAAMGNVMSGIAEALVATGVGIFVAIPAVVAYNVAQKKIADIESDTQGLAKKITAWLRAGKKGPADGDLPSPAERKSVSRLALAEDGAE
jgi:biopolymer transport protein ExbB/TolQ